LTEVKHPRLVNQTLRR